MKELTATQKKAEGSMSLSDYARIVWQKKLFLILPVLMSGFVAFVGVRFLEPMYESTSVIQMGSSDFLSEDVTRYVEGQERRQARNRIMIDRENLEIMTAEIMSSEFLDKIIAAFKLDTIEYLLRDAILMNEERFPHLTVNEIVHRNLWKMLRGSIDINNVGPGMFSISFYDSDPQVCTIIAQRITELFVEEQVIKQMQGLQIANEFTDEQLAIYKKRLEDSEAENARLKALLSQQRFSENPVTEVNLRQAETLHQHSQTSLNSQRSVVDKTEDNVRQIIGYLPDPGGIWRNQGVSELASNLANYRETELVLELSSEPEGSIRRTANQQHIVGAQNDLQRYLTNLIPQIYPTLEPAQRPLLVEYFLQEAILKSMEDKYYKLNTFINAFRNNLKLIPQLEEELVRSQDEVDANRELYHSFLRAKTSTQIREAVSDVKLGNVTVILENAKEPFGPVRPNKMKIMMIAVVFGFVVGFTFLILTEYTDTSFKRVDDVENFLEIKVLGVIPNFQVEGFFSRLWSKSTFKWGTIMVLVVAFAVTGFYYYGKTNKKHALVITSYESVNKQ